MSSGQISVQIRPRLEGRLSAAASRMEKSVSELVRMFVTEGLDRLEGGGTNPISEPVLERILMSLFQLEEMAARSFDPTSADRLSKEIRVNALDGVSDRARERAKKLMRGEWT